MEIETEKEGTRIFVNAYIISKELGDEWIRVDFLLDTGADITSLSSAFAEPNFRTIDNN